MNFYKKLFLRELIKIYGYTVRDGYKSIAKKIGGISYGTARNHLLALEEAKVLKIENKGKFHQTYHLDKNEVKRVFNG